MAAAEHCMFCLTVNFQSNVNCLSVTALAALPLRPILKLWLPQCYWSEYLFALEMISTPMMMWKVVPASLRSLMHFNDIPGKPQLRELWEGSDGGIPALWQLISFHISINNNSTCNN